MTQAESEKAEELRPCPHCGYHAKRLSPGFSTRDQRRAGYGLFQYGVFCAADMDCEAALRGFPSQKMADMAWNRRAPSAAPDLVEALQAARHAVERWEAGALHDSTMRGLRTALAKLEPGHE